MICADCIFRCTLGETLCTRSASTNGTMRMGITLRKICQNEMAKETVSPERPTNDKNNGPIKATERLLMMVYAAVTGMLPPSRPVTTGAEVAVPVSTQIIAACAKISLNGRNDKYTSALPAY